MVLLKILCLTTLLASSIAVEDCGVSNRRLPDDRIIRDDFKSQQNDWPWHAAILYDGNGQKDSAKYVCSGIFIHKKFVLTAADCVWDFENNKTIPRENLFVQLNKLDITTIHRRRIVNIILHEYYVPKNLKNGPNNNIALLEIAIGTSPIINGTVPACIPNFEFEELDGGIMAGWSIGTDGQIKGSLKEVYLPTVDILKCLESNRDDFPNFFNRETICAGYNTGSNSCNVDLGNGYYVQNSNGKWYAVGIVTFKKVYKDADIKLMCDDNYSVFSEINVYKKWIKTMTKIQNEYKNSVESTTKADKKTTTTLTTTTRRNENTVTVESVTEIIKKESTTIKNDYLAGSTTKAVTNKPTKMNDTMRTTENPVTIDNTTESNIKETATMDSKDKRIHHLDGSMTSSNKKVVTMESTTAKSEKAVTSKNGVKPHMKKPVDRKASVENDYGRTDTIEKTTNDHKIYFQDK